jgi:3-oxoacyl-[acyl-carrier protein] reductase
MVPSPPAPLLAGRVALVTGATRGIGRATAEILAAHGARVAVNGRSDPAAVEAFAADLAARHGTETLAVPADMADPKAVGAMVRAVGARFGRLDVLVANAGILGDGRLGMLGADTVDRVLAVNVAGPLHAIQTAARLMRRNAPGPGGRGAIVALGSIVGTRGNVGQALYAASKAAMVGLVLSAAKELGPDGIRVNAVAPGFVETAMTAHLDTAVRDRLLGGVALGRPGTPEDVARAVLFLVCDLSGYVSGQVLGVDGGMAL